MKPLLLLVDLQSDYLRAPALEPPADAIVERAGVLLDGSRSSSVPVAHVWTTVRRDDDRRMPHWKRLGKWLCVEGTEGHRPPVALQPTADEPVIHKTFFSGFSGGTLEGHRAARGIDTLVVAGVFLHGCVRATVLDAYERGLEVWVAEDAVGSDDPLHAAVTRRYLEARGVRFATVKELLSRFAAPGGPEMASPISGVDRVLVHRSPRDPAAEPWSIPVGGEDEVGRATAAARRALPEWSRSPIEDRARVLVRLAERLESESESLAVEMAREIGKPIFYGVGEVERTAVLLRDVASARLAEPVLVPGAPGYGRRRPVGVIAAITPFNNPVFLPLGKIAPALLYGNTVVWKPALAGTLMAWRIMDHLLAAGCPPGVVNLLCGDRSTAETLIANPEVDAVTLTGSSLAGHAAHAICARRRVPLQAELGGNNAAIVWSDGDLQDAATQIAEAAFGIAGQRCTANRRVVVDARCRSAFVQLLETAAAGLAWGDPLDRGTRIGPLVSVDQCRRVAGAVERAARVASAVIVPPPRSDLSARGAYHPPTIICCDDPRQEIVQEETFGPVLVVQSASDWPHAIALCNGVRQGLVAACFSASGELQERFLAEAQAGILKINRATADAAVDLPFGGWKSSGIGPPERREGDREFYTRMQTVYR